MKLLVDKLLCFSFDLYDSLLTESNRSFVFSPLLMFKLLGILLNAAEGDTKEYLQSLLYQKDDLEKINQKITELDGAVTIPIPFNLEIDDLEKIYQKITELDRTVTMSFHLQLLKYFSEQKDNGCVLNNFIFYNNEYSMRSSFRNTTKNFFDIIPEPIDLQNPEEVMKHINKCISDNTKGYIPNFLRYLGRNFNTMIISTIFFKGSWCKNFSEDTRNGNFYNRNGIFFSVVPMMKINEEFSALDNKKYQAIQLHYKQTGFSFLAIMPKKNLKLSEVSNDISKMGFDKFLSEMQRYEVELKMPKFKIETEINFSSIKNEKLNKVFSKLNELSILENKTFKEVQLLQKAIIDVNEKGTVATAAAACFVTDGISQRIKPISITFNKPFLYFIIKHCEKNHKDFNIPIFMGRYYGN